ncbi:MAG: hypothetical protein Q4C48_02070 [Lachnospiraceae bacterium]|nr:hypothetical protein [Lachnospiraceae bacterium]
MKKKILSFFCTAALILSLSAAAAFADALGEGAYTVGRETSYVNPDTGETEDGGTNIALGDSMCASIIEDHLLVEQANGKTYITIGVGLMSNITNVRVQVQDPDGVYHDAKLTKTGSCQRNGDTCNHYRFEVFSADGYISPIIYVEPMQRDVQFFVMPDIGSAQEGTGNFVSEMIPKEPESSVTPAAEPSPEPTTEPTPEPTTKPTEAARHETSEAKETSDHTAVWLIGGIVVLAAGGCGIWYFRLSKKKQK